MGGYACTVFVLQIGVFGLKSYEDKVLKFLLDKRKTPVDKNVTFAIGDYEKLPKIKNDLIIEAMNKLQAGGYIEYSRFGNKGALNVKLLPTADTYFDKKKAEKKQKRTETFRFWFPVIISLVALVISISDHFDLWYYADLILKNGLQWLQQVL